MSDIFRELCTEVLAYNEGRGRYNFSHLSSCDRENAAFDAWQDIRQRLKTALADNDQSFIADSSHLSDEEFAALMPQGYHAAGDICGN
jgi:hypothetical protein